MPNLERKKVRRNVGSLDVSYTTLKDMKHQIEYFIGLYGADAEVDKYTVPYDDYEYVAVFTLADEDDFEYNQRIAHEKHWEEQKEKHDAAEYKRLQEKYGQQAN